MGARKLSGASEMIDEGMRNEWKKETRRILESGILEHPLERTKGPLERTALWMHPLK